MVVEAIVGLGRKMNLTLVAEGVETTEQLNFLRELGCHQCQGYLFNKPMPAEEFEHLLKAQHERIQRREAQLLSRSN
jgi:EAL domain-containing protein (putative c-di-GMP-specific phosphodiesterase class I)